MNATLIGELVKLRYKLLWAKTRSRNGRIALFIIGYLFLVLGMVVLAMGGMGAGIMAVRSGKAELLAQGVLGGLFVNAIFGCAILGFGMSVGFSNEALRRYPLTSTERLAAEQIIGLLDPIWILILALELGLTVGLYVFGAGSFWMGLVAVLLLLVANYLAARIVLRGAERLMQNKSGTIVLLFFVVALSITPSLLMQGMRHSDASFAPVLAVLQYTPPFLAGAVVAGGGAVFQNLSALVGWSCLLFAALLTLERRPVRSATASAARISWDSPFDRAGALFGLPHGPLVARWLRYYWRNTRGRFFYLFAVPLAAALTVMLANNGRHGETRPLVVVAVATSAMVGFMGTGKIAANLFGYDGPGFRRYFLLPADAAATLRAGSYASVLMNGALIPVAAVVWIAFAGFDARAVLMLVSIAVTSLFVYNGLAVWTTILSPRRGDFDSSFGNDMSLGGNILYIGGVVAPMVLAQVLGQLVKPAAILAYWWWTLPAAALAACFYFVSLRKASGVFPSFRERLLAMAEGRR